MKVLGIFFIASYKFNQFNIDIESSKSHNNFILLVQFPLILGGIGSKVQGLPAWRVDSTMMHINIIRFTPYRGKQGFRLIANTVG